MQTKKQRIPVYIKMGNHQLDDSKGWAERKDFGLGKLNTRFFVEGEDQLDYAMHLIRQAYEYVP
ncbi:MAG: hypothetical protein ACE5IG_01145 [Dehalococcoidia bacterium]